MSSIQNQTLYGGVDNKVEVGTAASDHDSASKNPCNFELVDGPNSFRTLQVDDAYSTIAQEQDEEYMPSNAITEYDRALLGSSFPAQNTVECFSISHSPGAASDGTSPRLGIVQQEESHDDNKGQAASSFSELCSVFDSKTAKVAKGKQRY